MSKITIRDSESITYKEGFVQMNPSPVTEFVFDHRTQRNVTPKAAPRAGTFGKRTMNSGGRAAGKVYEGGDL